MAVAARFTARSAADAVRRELQAGDHEFALRLVVGTVRDWHAILASGDQAELDRFLTPPRSTGSTRWDTLLAAVVGRECRLAGVPRPPWTRPPPLASWWFVDPLPMLAARTMQRTAPDLACVGIWIDHGSFSTA